MVRMNFFGDFKCNDVSKLTLDNSLIAILRQADVNCVNFEAPIYVEGSEPIKKYGPNITNDSKAPDFLIKSGFNLFSLANNHIYDFGKESLLGTIQSFPNRQSIGAGDWNSAYTYHIEKVNDKKIAFIAVTHHEFGALYENQEYGAAWMLHPRVDEMILEAKVQCDYLFVISHCGMEQQFYPLPEVRTLYRHWINIGADGVFASHPHTPQPWEHFNGKPIVYSLGNFCFDTLWDSIPLYWNWSLIASLDIEEEDFNLKMHYCMYDEKERHLYLVDDNEDFDSHMKMIMSTFSDNELYLEAVKKQCLQTEMAYNSCLNAAGYYKLNLGTARTLLKRLIKRMLGRKYTPNYLPLLNYFNCETHRWATTRFLEFKKG